MKSICYKQCFNETKDKTKMSKTNQKFCVFFSGQYHRRSHGNDTTCVEEEGDARFVLDEAGLSAVVKIIAIICLALVIMTLFKEFVGNRGQNPTEQTRRDLNLIACLAIVVTLVIIGTLVVFNH